MQAASTAGIHNHCAPFRPSHIPLTTADAEAARPNHGGLKHNKCCRLCSWVPLVAGVATHSSRLVLHNHHMIGWEELLFAPVVCTGALIVCLFKQPQVERSLWSRVRRWLSAQALVPPTCVILTDKDTLQVQHAPLSSTKPTNQPTPTTHAEYVCNSQKAAPTRNCSVCGAECSQHLLSNNNTRLFACGLPNQAAM